MSKGLRVRSTSARFLSHNKRPFKIQGGLGSVMLHAVAPVAAEKIKAKTVFAWVELGQQLQAKPRPLIGIDDTFEHRVLYSLAKVQTRFRDTPQPAAAYSRCSRHVVAHEYEHVMFLQRFNRNVLTDSAP